MGRCPTPASLNPPEPATSRSGPGGRFGDQHGLLPGRRTGRRALVVDNQCSGDIAINGEGGNNPSAGVPIGVEIGNGRVTSTSGTVTIVGKSANNFTHEVVFSGNQPIQSGVEVRVQATNMSLGSSATIIAPSVVVETRLANTFINLGGDDTFGGPPGAPRALGLTDAELDRIVAGNLRIGNSQSGQITVGTSSASTAITHANNLELLTNWGITVNQSITMAADRNLLLNSVSTFGGISLAGDNADISTSGTGTLTVRAGRELRLATDGASLVTENGGIDIEANLAGAGTGNFTGVLNLGLIESRGSGDILIQARGNNGDGYSGNGNVRSTSNANTAGQGRISIHGIGGSVGFGFRQSGGEILSRGGDIHLIGEGANGSSGSGTRDGYQSDGVITAENGVTITVEGTAGNGGTSNVGVRVRGTIQSQSGEISISGHGGNGSGNRQGVTIDDALVTSVSADIHIDGVGGAGTTGASGVTTANDLFVRSQTGSVFITGTSGGPNDEDLDLVNTQFRFAFQAGDELHFFGNTIRLGTFVNFTPLVVIEPRTSGTLINLGGADVLSGGTLTLGLTDAELKNISASTIRIGTSDSGTITVSSLNRPQTNFPRHMELISGGDILFNAALQTVFNTAGNNATLGNLLLSPGPPAASGRLRPEPT